MTTNEVVKKLDYVVEKAALEHEENVSVNRTDLADLLFAWKCARDVIRRDEEEDF